MTITGGRLIRAMLDDEDGHSERTIVNKRILELANQAGIQLPDSSVYNGHIYQNSIERFAKLLVKECAVLADKHIQSKLYEDYTLGVGNCLKKHFGVEDE